MEILGRWLVIIVIVIAVSAFMLAHFKVCVHSLKFLSRSP